MQKKEKKNPSEKAELNLNCSIVNIEQLFTFSRAVNCMLPALQYRLFVFYPWATDYFLVEFKNSVTFQYQPTHVCHCQRQWQENIRSHPLLMLS